MVTGILWHIHLFERTRHIKRKHERNPGIGVFEPMFILFQRCTWFWFREALLSLPVKEQKIYCNCVFYVLGTKQVLQIYIVRRSFISVCFSEHFEKKINNIQNQVMKKCGSTEAGCAAAAPKWPSEMLRKSTVVKAIFKIKAVPKKLATSGCEPFSWPDLKIKRSKCFFLTFIESR